MWRVVFDAFFRKHDRTAWSTVVKSGEDHGMAVLALLLLLLFHFAENAGYWLKRAMLLVVLGLLGPLTQVTI